MALKAWSAGSYVGPSGGRFLVAPAFLSLTLTRAVRRDSPGAIIPVRGCRGSGPKGGAALSLDFARLGGIGGILFVALVIPSFLSAPDSPVATSSRQEVFDYVGNRQDGILISNGLLLVFAAFFFLLFPRRALRRAARRGG